MIEKEKNILTKKFLDKELDNGKAWRSSESLFDIEEEKEQSEIEIMVIKIELPKLQQDLLEILKEKPLCRKEIVNKLDQKRTTIFDNLAKIQEKGFVKKFSRTNGKPGRPIVYWKLISSKNNEKIIEELEEKLKDLKIKSLEFELRQIKERKYIRRIKYNV